MSINWVMLSDTEGFIRLPGERIIYTSPPRTTLSLQSHNAYAGPQPLSLSSNAGCVHLTNQRIVYLPLSPTPALQSFSAPILNLHDTHVSAPFFGPNVWRAALQPVPGGGIASKYSPVELKMVFRDGGAFDFHSNFERIKERLHQALEVARESGHIVGDGSDAGGGRGAGQLSGVNLAAVDLEELPAYEEARRTAPVEIAQSSPPLPLQEPDVTVPIIENPASPVSETARTPPATEGDSETLSSPTEPPPGYEEVQRQSVATELERSLRSLE